MSQRQAYVGFSDLVRCLRADIALSDDVVGLWVFRGLNARN